MAINKKLIHFDMTKQLFMSNANGLNNLTKPTNGIVGNIPYYSVVFLKDGYIWTHGHFINGTGIADSVSGNATISWSKITDKPSTFTPSAHTQAYTTLTGSGTTANQAIVSSGTANGWTLKTLGSRAFDSTSYLPLSGGTMTGTPYIIMPSSAATISDSQPFGITYGRIQGWSNIIIAADTDRSASEYAVITSGYDVANATKANGLAIGYNTLTWKNNTVWHAGNLTKVSQLTNDSGYITQQKKLANYYDSRPTTANIQLGDGSLRHFMATSSMTEGKPTIGDSNIIHLSWDNNGGWDKQIAVADGDNCHIQFRGQSSGTWRDWITVLDSSNSSVSKSGETLTVKINNVSQSLTNTWRGIQNNLTSSSTTDSLSAYQGHLLANGSARDNTKLPLSGGTMVGTISASSDAYGGGGFHNGYANIILRGNTTTGTSGIVFSSSKGDTSINRPSDCAFIQYHPYGISTATAVGTNPTIGTSGETGRFVIGIHNDSGDQLWLQTSAVNDLKHVVGANVYTIYDSGNLPAYPTKASWNYDDRYVASVSISGNYLRINKNGANTDLTIPYATSADNANKLNGYHCYSFHLRGSVIDTHAEGENTIILGFENELFAFYKRGCTCTVYEVTTNADLTKNDLSSYKTGKTYPKLNENIFNGLNGYNQDWSYNGDNLVVFDLTMPSHFWSPTFFWSFGSGTWKPAKLRILSTDTRWSDESYNLKYSSDSAPAYGKVSVGGQRLDKDGDNANGVNKLRIVCSKFLRISQFGITDYYTQGLSTVYLSRTIDNSIYRSFTPAADNTYTIGTSSLRWKEVRAVNFYGAFNGTATNAGNADTVDGLHASNIARFYLSPMTSGAPADSAKSWFTETMPASSGAIVYNVPGSEKTIIAGKSVGPYGHMLQLNYDDTYLRILRYQAGSWKSTDWEKISAGYADSAGSVAWGNVSGKPSEFNPSANSTYYLEWKGNAGKGNMNDVARSWKSSTGMTNLSSSSVDNGDMSGWTHFFSTSYSDGGAGTNAWIFQLACPAGSSNLQFRSRNGGTVTNGAAWSIGWTKILHAGNSSVLKSGETLTVKINGTSQSLTNTWRGITDTYNTTSASNSISLSQLGAYNMYDNLTFGRRWYCNGDGTNGWCLVAEFDTSRAYINKPITFEFSGRGLPLTHITVQFANSGAADPNIELFGTDCAKSFGLYKAGTSKWQLYGQDPSSVWQNLELTRVYGNTEIVTIKMERVASIPDGIIPITTYIGNVGYATKATQDSDGKAINATYLKRSGGTITGNITIGNSTFYASGTNGGINSLAVADDCILGDCNIGGHLGLKSLNTTNAGISFYNSSGGHLGRFTVNSSGTPTWNDTAFSLTSHNHDATYFKHCSSNNTDPITGLYNGYGVCMTTTSGINGNWWHVFSAGWSNTSDWISQLALPTQDTTRGAWFRIRQSSTNSDWIRLHDTQNTYVSNNKGYINNTEITYVNNAGNADKVDNVHLNSILTAANSIGNRTQNDHNFNSALNLGVYEVVWGGYIANHPSDWEDGSNHYGQMLHFGDDNHGYILLDRGTQNMYFKNIGGTTSYGEWYKVAHSGNSSVSKSGETLTVKINNISQSLTNTWRGIQDNLTSSSNTTESLSAKQGYLLANGSARDNTKLSLAGGTLTGTLSFSNNVGISGIMGGGSDGWGIVGTGEGDNGRLKIYVADNATSDWLDFEFRDWSGTTYTPLSMTGNQIVFNYNPTVSGHSLIHAGNIGSQSVASATKLTTARTLWGQSFNGTGNVDGKINLTYNANEQLKISASYTMGVNGYAHAINAINPSLSSGEAYLYEIGRAANNSNLAYFGYVYGGDSGTSYATIGLHSHDRILNVTASDRVGIGTTTPSYKLDVNGTLHASGATTLSSTLYVGNNATIAGTLGVYGTTTLKSATTITANAYISGETFFSAVDAFRLNYGSYGVIHRNDGGSYWILLTNKNEQNGGFNSLRPFHIDLSTGTVYMDNNAIIDNLAFTQCNISMGGRVNATWGYDLNTNDYYGLYFKSKNSSSTGILFNDDGNVGINTTSPSYKLDVNGTLHVSDTITATSLAADYKDTWNDGTHAHPWYGYDLRYANTGVYSTTISDYFGMTLKTKSGNISITNGGNVGIGTFAPLRKLHVIGEAIFGESGYVATQGTGSGYSGTWVGQGFMELSAPNPYIDFHANKSTADFTSRLIQWSDKVRLLYVSSDGAYNGYILTCEGNHHNPVILGIFDLKRSGPGSTIWTLDNICGPCVFTLANNWGSDVTGNSHTYWTIPSNLLRVEINGILGDNYATKTTVKAAACIGTVMTRWMNNQPVVSNRSHKDIAGCSVECLCTDKAPGTNLYYDSNSPGKYIYITGARPWGYDDGDNGLAMDQFRRTGHLSYLRVRFVVYGWLE